MSPARTRQVTSSRSRQAATRGDPWTATASRRPVRTFRTTTRTPRAVAPERTAYVPQQGGPATAVIEDDIDPAGSAYRRSSTERGAEVGDLNLHDLLITVLERKASDLHLTAGAVPMLRLNGELVPLDDHEPCSPGELQRVLFAALTQKQRERFEEELELDISYSVPGKARFRVNLYRQRESVGAAFRLIPYEIKSLESLGIPPAVKNFSSMPRGMVLVTGPDRLRQVDHTGRPDRPGQPHAPRPHHDGRGPDRVPAPAQGLPGQPARGRRGHPLLRGGAQARAAAGPGHHPGRRDAGPGDDLGRPDGRRDRSPRLRHPAHPGRRADDRPGDRRLPGRAAGAGAHHARRRDPGRRVPDALQDG